MKQVPISKVWAEDTENKIIPTEQETANGIAFQAQIESDVSNGFLNQLYEAVKYEQRTGGYYNSFIPYEINSTVKILVSENGTKSILSLLRISGNSEANRPPYTGATETDVNGVIEWSGGTFNSVYWKEIESKSLLERDKPIEDTGSTITFDSSGTVNLTNEATTRTLSAGLWVGQTATLFNSTANTITVTDGEFTFTILANDKREVQWNGTKWKDIRLYKGIVYKQYQELFSGAFSFVESSTPWAFYGTQQSEWQMMFEDSGAYERIEGGSPVNQINPLTGLRDGEIPNIKGVARSFSRGFLGGAEGILQASTPNGGGLKDGGYTNSEYIRLELDASLQNSGTAEDPFYPYVEGAKYNEVRNISTRLYKYIG